MVSGQGTPPGEHPIHGEIYRARKDVNCILHTHPPWAVGFGIVGCPIQPVNQDAVVFYEGLSVFSGTAELVNEAEQGAQLARDLGNCRAILMRNHGVTTVAGTVEEALVWALNLGKALQAQLLAMSHGGVRHIVDLALAKGIAENRLESPNRFEVIFAYYVREADRILGRYRGVNDEQVPNH